MTTYCIAAFEGANLLDNPTGLNTAQVGGKVGHLMESCTAFIVRNEQTGNIVMRYRQYGDGNKMGNKK